MKTFNIQKMQNKQFQIMNQAPIANITSEIDYNYEAYITS